MIYAYACIRVQVSVSFESDPACSHRERLTRVVAHSDLWLGTLGQEAEEMLNGALKTTQHGQEIKKL